MAERLPESGADLGFQLTLSRFERHPSAYLEASQNMSQIYSNHESKEPPAMGERHARWGFGYQDKVATERILSLMREDLREGNTDFEGVRLADLDAGRVDDFVLVMEKEVEGNSIKWSGEATPLNWGDLIGANGLLRELADGYQRLKDRWPGKAVSVRLQSNRPPSSQEASCTTHFYVQRR